MNSIFIITKKTFDEDPQPIFELGAFTTFPALKEFLSFTRSEFAKFEQRWSEQDTSESRPAHIQAIYDKPSDELTDEEGRQITTYLKECEQELENSLPECFRKVFNVNQTYETEFSFLEVKLNAQSLK